MRIKLDIPLRTEEIAEAVGARGPSQIKHREINHITLNSKAVQRGDLFIGLKGESFRGSDFANEAAKRGATVMCESECDKFICVSDGRLALGKIAALYKSKLKSLSNTVMITGSVGKSTTKNFCKKIIVSAFKSHATEGNLNNDVGLPVTILRAPKDTESLILEAGMNSLGEISYLSRLCAPTLGVITNVGRAHIGKLGSKEETARAKLEITDGLRGKLFLPYGEELLKREGALTVAFGNSEGDYSIIPSEISSCGSGFAFFKNGKKLFDGRLNITGVHFLKSLSFAIAIADSMGIATEDIEMAISEIGEKEVGSKIISFRDFSVYDDSYNASPESVKSALNTLSLFSDKPRAALLGDMLELGEYAASAHREIGRAAAEVGVERLYLIGEYCEYIAEGAIDGGLDPSAIFTNPNSYSPQITAEQILKNHQKSEIILFKASHSLELYRVLDYIKFLEG